MQQKSSFDAIEFVLCRILVNNLQSPGDSVFSHTLYSVLYFRFSLVGFTEVQYNEENKIDSNKSLYSTYDYSGMITLKQNPGLYELRFISCIVEDFTEVI